MAEEASNANRMKIRKFDPKKLKIDRIIFLVGKRGSGKSVLEEDILGYVANEVEHVLAITPTRGSQEMFQKSIPDGLIQEEYYESKIAQLVAFQKKCDKRGINGPRMRRVGVFLDDMMFDAKDIFKGKTMRDLFMNGRHYNVFFMNSMQYCMDMPIAMRAQVDYVFAMWEPSAKNRRKLWENFFGIFENFQQFETVFKQITGDYTAMVIDTTASSTCISDSVFWYKAKEPEKQRAYRMGSDAFWALWRKFQISPEERRAMEDARREAQQESAQAKKRKDEDGKKIARAKLEALPSAGDVVASADDGTDITPAAAAAAAVRPPTGRRKLGPDDVVIADEDGDTVFQGAAPYGGGHFRSVSIQSVAGTTTAGQSVHVQLNRNTYDAPQRPNVSLDGKSDYVKNLASAPFMFSRR